MSQSDPKRDLNRHKTKQAKTSQMSQSNPKGALNHPKRDLN